MQPVITPRAERGPEYSYAGVLVRADRAAVLTHLRESRFTGWVGPQEDGWVVLVSGRPHGGAEMAALAARLAEAFGAPALAASVHRDRVLRLSMWDGPTTLGAYHSNPAFGADEDEDDTEPDPVGVEHAAAYAGACGRPDEAEALEETLAELLDEEEQTESERLWAALGLLGLPRWLVAASVLPKDVPGGPAARDLVRLFRGRSGPAADVAGWVTGPVRRRRHRKYHRE